MISIIQPIAAGNALRLFIEPPSGAQSWRILRKGADSFSGEDDDTALVAYEGSERVFVDCESLTNDQLAYYRPYYFDGTTWSAGATASRAPHASYSDLSSDALTLLRDRLEAGLAVEVARGTLNNELGYIQVFSAPPNMEGDIRFPLVTVQLENESPLVRGIGEDITGSDFDDLYDLQDAEGWLADVQISIAGWSLNPDERIELRKALRRIIIANLPVFADHGLDQISFSSQDYDAVSGEYDANLYQVMGSFNCTAPVYVDTNIDPLIIGSTDVQAN